MQENDRGAWNPYLAGSLSGLLIVLSVWGVGKYLGASTTFVRAAGMIEQLLDPSRVAGLAYFIKEKPVVDWQWMFVAGIFLGSLLSALTSGSFRWQAVPDSFAARFAPRGASAGWWPSWAAWWPCSAPAWPTADPAATG